MNKKYIFIIIIAVFVIGITVLLFITNKQQKTVTINANINTEPVTINTQVGNIIIEDAVENREGQYAVLRRTKDYEILHYPVDNSFLITIYNVDFEQARTEAELDFLKTLNLSERDVCQLTVTIGVPYFVNPDPSGYSHDLSFCEGY